MKKCNKPYLFLVLSFLVNLPTLAQIDRVYLFPGQGSDYRIFDSLQIGSEIEKKIVNYPIPERNEQLKDYANRLINQIDTTSSYAFIGVSLGGMLAVELNNSLTPKTTILVSSVKARNELPKPLKSLKHFPINKGIPAICYKWGSFIAQPIFEPDRKKNKATFKAMLKAKDPKFLKRATYMISNWENTQISDNIFHIHGTDDNTLPLKHINADVIIESGSHMMMLTRGNEISEIIQMHLNSL